MDENDVKVAEEPFEIKDLGAVSKKTHGLFFGCWIDGAGAPGGPPTWFCG